MYQLINIINILLIIILPRMMPWNHTISRPFACPCGKSYLSYPALFTHVKTKHNSKPPGELVRPRSINKRGRPKKVIPGQAESINPMFDTYRNGQIPSHHLNVEEKRYQKILRKIRQAKQNYLQEIINQISEESSDETERKQNIQKNSENEKELKRINNSFMINSEEKKTGEFQQNEGIKKNNKIPEISIQKKQIQNSLESPLIALNSTNKLKTTQLKTYEYKVADKNSSIIIANKMLDERFQKQFPLSINEQKQRFEELRIKMKSLFEEMYKIPSLNKLSEIQKMLKQRNIYTSIKQNSISDILQDEEDKWTELMESQASNPTHKNQFKEVGLSDGINLFVNWCEIYLSKLECKNIEAILAMFCEFLHINQNIALEGVVFNEVVIFYDKFLRHCLKLKEEVSYANVFLLQRNHINMIIKHMHEWFFLKNFIPFEVSLNDQELFVRKISEKDQVRKLDGGKTRDS